MTDMFEKGLAIRKAVLGKEYVEKSLAGADDFTRAGRGRQRGFFAGVGRQPSPTFCLMMVM